MTEGLQGSSWTLKDELIKTDFEEEKEGRLERKWGIPRLSSSQFGWNKAVLFQKELKGEEDKTMSDQMMENSNRSLRCFL